MRGVEGRGDWRQGARGGEEGGERNGLSLAEGWVKRKDRGERRMEQ